MEISVKSLADMVNGLIEGNPDAKINSFAKIEEAFPGSLCFLANEKYTEFIYTTKATAVLVKKDFIPEKQVNTTLIRVDDPYATLADLLNLIQKNKPMPVGVENPSFIAEGVLIPEEAYIGAFSYIGKNVSLGKRVKIYPQCFIGDNAKIGENTIIYPGVKIYNDCEIGNNCILHSGAVIGADGFGFAPKNDEYEKIPQMGNVIISDNVEIGANTCIDRATFGHTIIGKGTKLDNLIQIAHNVTIGENNVFAAQGGIAGSTKIGDNNRFGGQVGVAGHISIGNANEIGAQSGIPNNVGSNKRLLGYPAIDAAKFARNIVYINKLNELFKKLK